MILLHDLVEIDRGDHRFIWPMTWPLWRLRKTRRPAAVQFELPDGAVLLALGTNSGLRTADARMARRMDHIQPMFQVLCASAPLADHVAIVRDNMTAAAPRGFGPNGPRRWPRRRRCWMAASSRRTIWPHGWPFLAEADRLKTVLRASTLTDARAAKNKAPTAGIGALCAGHGARRRAGRRYRRVIIAC